MFLRALVVVVLSASAFAGKAERDLNAEIVRLSSPDATERGAAQRWLAAHLENSDRALIQAQLRGADAEARARWIEILASEDRLALVGAKLAASNDASAVLVGRAALESAIYRWNPAARDKPKFGSELAEAMGAWIQPRIEIDLALATAPLEDVLDLVTRVAPGRCGIAVDPRCDAGERSRTRETSVGSFTSVLRELALRHDLQLVGFACGEEKTDPARWLVLLPKPSPETHDVSALVLLRDWSITFAHGESDTLRSAAARALAASGWPTGIALLAQSWRENGDKAGLDGLMLAARRDRVAPELCAASVQEAVRAELARALADTANDGRAAIAAALALGATGVRGPEGRDLCAPALDGLGALGGRALFARLVEIDARGPNDPAARAALDLVLVRDEVPVGARFLALETRARFSEPLEGLVRANEIVEFAASHGRLADLARWLRDARSFPPETWRDPAGLAANWSPPMRAFVAGVWLARRETATAAAVVAYALNAADAPTREALALAVRDAARDADPSASDAFFAQLESRDGAEHARTLRLVALAGGVRSEESADEVLSGIAKPATTREDLLLLGALAASPRGAQARTRLIEALSGPAVLVDMFAARERALEVIRATRDFELEREFENAVHSSPLRAKRGVLRWPPSPIGEPLRLGDLDRSCARFGL